MSKWGSQLLIVLVEHYYNLIINQNLSVMRKLPLLLCALALTILSGTASSKQSRHSVVSVTTMVNYVWYEDPELIVPTGTVSDVSTELTRLRTAFPGYTFSTIHSMGLYEFEYGHYPNFTIVKIFSDL